MFKRKICDELVTWKRRDARECALLTNGARRVGKSFIVEEFAKREYRSYVMIDFSKVDKELKALFTKFITKLDTFFAYLSSYTDVTLYEHETLIVLTRCRSFQRRARPSKRW